MTTTQPDKRQTDNQTRTDSRSNPGKQEVTLPMVLERIIAMLANVFAIIPHLIVLLTQRPGSAIPIGLVVLYFAGLSVEGYWQAIPGDHPSFIPKPFIADDASLLNLWTAFQTGSFWLMLVVSLTVQGIQAAVMREISIAQAKAEYEAVRNYTVPETAKNAIDLAELRRRRYKKAGMKAVQQRGAVILLVYLIDVTISMVNFPLFGLRVAGQFFINMIWAVLSIFGTESAISAFMDAIKPVTKDSKTAFGG